jgi:hypothetical protein
MADRSYYLCKLIFHGKSRFVIWYDSDRDGVLLDCDGKITAFGTRARTLAFAKKNGLSIAPEPVTVYDFDAIAAWCAQPHPSRINCENFLDAWNMFTDVAASIGRNSLFAAADKRLKSIYDKLFFGNNLPSITPAGRSYEPEWDETEVEAIAKLFTAGLQDLNGSMPDAE